MFFQGIKRYPVESCVIPLNHFGARFGAHNFSILMSRVSIGGGGWNRLESLTKNFRRNSLTDAKNPDNGNIITLVRNLRHN